MGPTHGKYQGECHKWLGTWLGWEDYAKFWYIGWTQVDTIETIRYIHLDHVYRALCWVGKQDLSQDPFQCMTELHGFRGGNIGGVFIDTREGVVADPSGPPISLRHYSWRTDPEIFKMLDCLVR
jgi:hypothetical protein